MGKYSCNGKTYHVTSGKNEKKVAKEVASNTCLNKDPRKYLPLEGRVLTKN